MSLHLNSNNDYCVRTGAANLGSTTVGTLLGWCRKQSSVSSTELFSLGLSGDSVRIRVASETQIRCGKGSESGSDAFVDCANDTWHRFALQVNGTAISIYMVVGGTATLVYSGTLTNPLQVAGLELGQDSGTFTTPNSAWRYVRYWTRALSTGEIEAEFAMTPDSETPAASVTDLYLSWPLATGTDTTDLTGNSRVPTISGAATSAEEPTIDEGGGGGVPTVTDAGDEAFYDGETGVVITGTNFGATQGTGEVILSPTDDPDDVDAVAQTVTAWGATSITITVDRGTLPLDTNLYLFVTNDSAQANAAGYVVQIQARVFVRLTLKDLDGNPVANETDITLLVWRGIPTTGAPNPDQALTVSTNGSAATNQQVDRGSLAVNDPILVATLKDGTPLRGGIRKIIPAYE